MPVVALDAYFTEKPKLDFVKMDIEGGEVQATIGMRRILRNHCPICLIEVHGEAGLAEKIKYYLANDAEREAICQAEHRRAVNEHS